MAIRTIMSVKQTYTSKKTGNEVTGFRTSIIDDSNGNVATVWTSIAFPSNSVVTPICSIFNNQLNINGLELKK